MKSLPSQDFLRSVLRYDRMTGRLFWRQRPISMFRGEGWQRRWNDRYADKLAGSLNPDGYLYIRLGGESYAAHRVIWKMVKGFDPPADIDHKDGNRTRNMIGNMRCCSRKQNCKNQGMRKNNRTGVMGVSMQDGKFRAQGQVRGRNTHLGLFSTLEEAASCRANHERRMKFHSNHGRQPQ